MRVVFTGGSGKAGRHAIPVLLEAGHEVVNWDLKPLDQPGVRTLPVELTDAGQVQNAMTAYGRLRRPRPQAACARPTPWSTSPPSPRSS